MKNDELIQLLNSYRQKEIPPEALASWKMAVNSALREGTTEKPKAKFFWKPLLLASCAGFLFGIITMSLYSLRGPEKIQDIHAENKLSDETFEQVYTKLN